MFPLLCPELRAQRYVSDLDRLKHKGKVIRCICLLDHPLPNTKNMPSVQVIIPQRQTGRKSDIYVPFLARL